MWGSHELDHEILQPVADHAQSTGAGTLYIVSPPAGIYVRVVKPTIDRVFAATVLVAVLPVLIACAIAVRVNLGSPIFFTQVRVGRGGKRFKVYKFRTMQQDRRDRALDPEADLVVHDGFVGSDRRKTHKSPSDPRLTGVGRFLRKWSLDELPQLWNVVRGDMSIIGPRPELPEIVASYNDWEHARHMVRPGLTGLWQVSARGEGRPMHEHVGVDIEYVAGISAFLDLRIIVRTPLALLTNRGF